MMKFSVIVPVYNVEQYLNECLDSIICQDYDNFEIIIVDDGSTDSSSDICDFYAEKDKKIKVIHKKNGGLSSARNVGIELAIADYLVFFDSDDVMEKGCLKKFNETLDADTDVLITEIYDTVDVSTVATNELLFLKPDSNKKNDIVEFVLYHKKHTWSAPQYIVSRKMVEKNRMRFAEGYYHEDIYWTANLLRYAERYAFYNKLWYIRRLERQGSITNVPKVKRTLDIIELLTKFIDNISDDLSKVIANRMVNSMVSSLKYCSKYSKQENEMVAECLKKNKQIWKYASGTRNRMLVWMIRLLGERCVINMIAILYTVYT